MKAIALSLVCHAQSKVCGADMLLQTQVIRFQYGAKWAFVQQILYYSRFAEQCMRLFILAFSEHYFTQRWHPAIRM